VSNVDSWRAVGRSDELAEPVNLQHTHKTQKHTATQKLWKVHKVKLKQLSGKNHKTKWDIKLKKSLNYNTSLIHWEKCVKRQQKKKHSSFYFQQYHHTHIHTHGRELPDIQPTTAFSFYSPSAPTIHYVNVCMYVSLCVCRCVNFWCCLAFRWCFHLKKNKSH